MNSSAPSSTSLSNDADPSLGAPSGIRTCLIVDDDAGIRRLLAYNLGKLGVTTAECTMVAAVEPTLAQNEPDLIFLDLGLADGDEHAVLALLARRGFAGRVQIVSGRSVEVLDEICDWGRSKGLAMLPPLPKPFRSSAIRSLVEACS